MSKLFEISSEDNSLTLNNTTFSIDGKNVINISFNDDVLKLMDDKYDFTIKKRIVDSINKILNEENWHLKRSNEDLARDIMELANEYKNDGCTIGRIEIKTSDHYGPYGHNCKQIEIYVPRKCFYPYFLPILSKDNPLVNELLGGIDDGFIFTLYENLNLDQPKIEISLQREYAYLLDQPEIETDPKRIYVYSSLHIKKTATIYLRNTVKNFNSEILLALHNILNIKNNRE